MTEFERSLVQAFNEYLGLEPPKGYAHRKKQHRFSSQECDVLVDSSTDRFYLAIECKSIKDSSTNKLYFTTHFSETDEGHQLDRLKEFCKKSGRTGYIAVEVKRGQGRQRRAFMVPLDMIHGMYSDGEPGIRISTFTEDRNIIEIPRDGSEYTVPSRLLTG